MKIFQQIWSESQGWDQAIDPELSQQAQLVLVFGSRGVFEEGKQLQEVEKNYPNAYLFGCSTSGEIHGTRVYDDTLAVTAIQFEKTRIKPVCVDLDEASNSREAGTKIAGALEQDGLVHVLALTDGLEINGTEFVAGLVNDLPENVTVTGGLAGDGAKFESTLVVAGNARAKRCFAAIGFYSSDLKIGYGSLGGWDSFGPERLITRSKGNILYELDGRSALELYKEYLGEHAKGLPATGLLFPLSLRTKSGDTGVVRTILAVDEEKQSMTFAGDVPEGSYARLMKANFDRLVDGASGAAQTCYEAVGSVTPDLAILISCVGRKMILKQRVEEEVEAVSEVLGSEAVLSGFYSYGEISPFTQDASCKLHNQTMTITTFSEK